MSQYVDCFKAETEATVKLQARQNTIN